MAVLTGGSETTTATAWWKTAIKWICGIEKQVQLTAHQKAQMTSLDEVPFYRTLCSVNALALMAVAVFFCAFFA